MVNKNFPKIFLISLIVVFFSLNFVSIFNKFQHLTSSSYSSLIQALDSINSAEAQAKSLNLEQASQDFQQAKQALQQIQDSTWVFDNQILSTTEIATSGKLITQVGTNLAQVSENLKSLPNQFLEANKQAFLDPEKTTDQDLTEDIYQTKNTIELAITQLQQANQLLEKQSYNLLPSDLRKKYQQSLDKLDQVQEMLKRLDILLAGALDLLGHQTSHRYLVLLQNQNELRPLGGFLGSVLSFEIDRGIIQNINFQDIYDIDGQSSKTLPSPPEFNDFDAIFSRDANYTPDPEASLLRISQLFESSKQPNYRSFLILNHNFLSKLLSAVGPVTINIQDQNYYLTSDNFSLILNTIVELDQNKNVVGPTITQLQSHILNNINMSDLTNIVYRSFLDRDVQFFTLNQDVQAEFESLPTLHSISTSNDPLQDYLLITETNIGGNKSDQYIQREIIHQTKFQDSLKPVNNLKITKTHTYSNQQEIINNSILAENGIPQIPDQLRFILGRGENKTRTKIYIPKDSSIISFQGDFTKNPELFYDSDMDRDYILFESLIEPQQTKTYNISYKPNIQIPKDRVTTYNLLHQKPSGYSYQFQKNFLSETKDYAFNSPSFSTQQNQTFQVESQLKNIQQDQKLEIYLYSP